MMGAQVQSGGESDLNTITDAKVYNQRLKALTEQAAHAKTSLEQARAENQAMVATKEEVEAIKASTLEMLNKNLALENDLKRREDALVERAKVVAEGENQLNLAKEEFETVSATLRAGLTKRDDEIRKYELECKKQIDEEKIAFERHAAEHMAQLDAAHKDAMAAAKKAADRLAVKEKKVEGALAEAEEQKAEYDEKVAALKKLVG